MMGAKSQKVCVECGKEFTANGRQSTCGPVCRKVRVDRKTKGYIAARSKKTKQDKECSVCGSGFTPRSTRSVYCSLKCSEEGYKRKVDAQRVARQERSAAKKKAKEEERANIEAITLRPEPIGEMGDEDEINHEDIVGFPAHCPRD